MPDQQVLIKTITIACQTSNCSSLWESLGLDGSRNKRINLQVYYEKKTNKKDKKLGRKNNDADFWDPIFFAGILSVSIGRLHFNLNCWTWPKKHDTDKASSVYIQVEQHGLSGIWILNISSDKNIVGTTN